MGMRGPLLADTSVWVMLLRRGRGGAPVLAQALEEGRVVTTGPVVAELLQGLASEANRVNLERQIGVLPFVSLSRREWLIAGHIAGALRGRGTPVSLADVEIATAARSIEIPVLTSDRDFTQIADAFGDLQVEFV